MRSVPLPAPPVSSLSIVPAVSAATTQPSGPSRVEGYVVDTAGHGRFPLVSRGDTKGNELPLQFFLDYAWNPKRRPVEEPGEWERRYAAQDFGADRSREIAEVLREYGRIQSDRKPELLDRKTTGDGAAVTYDDQASPFSLTDYREIDRRWKRIPDLGRTGAGMEPFPVTAPSREPTGPRLEYEVTVRSAGPVTVWAHLSPRNPVLSGPGLRYAVSFDDQPPQVVDIIAATGADDTAMNRQRERNTSNNTDKTATVHELGAGAHTLKFWMVDPTVVVHKLVVDTGGLRPSYLGPPESRRVH